LKKFPGTPVVSDPDSTTVSRRLRSTSSSAPSADKLLDQTEREDPDQWWRSSNGSGARADVKRDERLADSPVRNDRPEVICLPVQA
jgi:hypothetical protein